LNLPRGGAALLKLGDGGIGLEGAARFDVGQAALCVGNQQQVDALALEKAHGRLLCGADDRIPCSLGRRRGLGQAGG
jgi:hypothetical protein